ncbi:GNAT family N-acetyltransferase [Candidatus Thioglobus sp.]|nr:GNAT family protein [Candidatus Thioglobus sp.]MDA8872175.1 GNAT family N-acetyltransferase [Candidatus Thioglobus sp.]
MKLDKENIRYMIMGRSIYLKPITKIELSDEYLSWLNDTTLNQFLDVSKSPPKNINELADYVNAVRCNSLCDVFAIYDKKIQKHVGNIAITHNDVSTGTATHGCMIGDEFSRKRGVGAEASILINEFMFSQSHIHRIQEGAISKNIDACRVLISMGFKHEGTLRKAAISKHGELWDINKYGILIEEWRKMRDKFSFILDSFSIKPIE